jgi:hypothetical protein
MVVVHPIHTSKGAEGRTGFDAGDAAPGRLAGFAKLNGADRRERPMRLKSPGQQAFSALRPAQGATIYGK